MTARDLESKLEVFSVLGRPVEVRTKSRFCFLLVHSWPIPSFSPLVLLSHQRLEPADLVVIERLFGADGALQLIPYFNFFEGEGLYDEGQIASTCASAGWTVEEEPLAVNLMYGGTAFELPAAHDVSVSSFAQHGLPDEYRRLVREGFRADDDYLRCVASAYQDEGADTRIVLIRNHGEAVAGGTVNVRAGLGFFTWGTVGERHRRLGYHRLLVAVCRSVAAAAGARVSALTTRNPQVRGRCDEVIAMYICRKRGERKAGPDLEA